MSETMRRMDELVRDYLLYRGFTGTLKTLDVELKFDKDKGFRVEKIVEQLLSYVWSYDLAGLQSFWDHLDRRVFSRLEYSHNAHVRKLEISVLRLYVVNAVQTNQKEKVAEFFDKMSGVLQNHGEWKDWFVLPFLKNPEQNSTFELYFSKQWQETLTISLHNFLSIIFQAMPVPDLLNFDSEQQRMSQLQEENNLLKRQVATLEHIEKEKKDNGLNDNWSNSVKFCATAEILDDFAAIPEEDHSKEGQFKSTARGLGIKKQASPQPTRKPSNTPVSTSAPTKSSPLPSRAFSAILGQKRDQAVPVTSTVKTKDVTKRASNPAEKVVSVASRQKQQKAYDRQRQELFSKPRTMAPPKSSGETPAAEAPAQPVSQESVMYEMTNVPGGNANTNNKGIVTVQAGVDGVPDIKTDDDTILPGQNIDFENKLEPSEELPGAPPFLVLSQDEYTEHHSSISACRFSPSGTTVASMDVDGVVKVWRFSPNPATVSTIMFKAPLMSLEWASKSDRMMLLGSSSGSIKMYDVEAKKPLCEVDIVNTHPRVLSLSCSPSSTSFVSSSATNSRSRHRSSDTEPSSSSKLLVWDMKVMKIQRELQLKPGVGCVNCTNYNHNGNLLVTGGMDGMIRIFDMHRYESLLSWQAHTGETYATQFSPDETSIYSMGSDGKFIQWSIHKIGEKVCDLPIHEGATGPFVMSGFGGYHRQHLPRGKLFAFDSSGQHMLTCAPYGGIIYQRHREQGLMRTLTILGHKTPVVNVDWCASFNTGMCLTGSMDGRLQVTTLLSQ